MNIAKFSIKHKVAVILAFIMVVVFGAQSFSNLSLALTPEMELPVAAVMTVYAGAGPEEIENLITKEIEEACVSVSGVDEITSDSAENVSTVMIQFVDGTDMDRAVDDIKDKVDRIEANLPEDADTPLVLEMDMDSMPVSVVALTGTDLASLQILAEDVVAPRLERISGVSSVDVTGGYEYEIAVDTYPERMDGYGLTVSYVAQILAAENVAVPAGSIDSGSQSLAVSTDGEYESVDDVKNALIPLPTGGTVRLDEIADVRYMPQDQTSIAKVNNEECVVLMAYKQSDANLVNVAEAVQEQMTLLQEENPTLHYTIVVDQSDFINMAIDSVIENIIIGVVLAALVLFVFLRSKGPVLTISLSMPICIVSVFLVMNALDITMNIMSLGGMALGVGMIVDNSIVVLENIYRFRGDGRSRYESCVEGTREVAGSVFGSTMTTLAVFVPIGLMDGMIGMMVGEFALTIAALIGASMVVALVLVPLLCYMTMDIGGSKLQPVNTGTDLMDKPFGRKYRKLLEYCITHTKKAVFCSLAVIAVFAGLIAFSFGTNGFEMMPEMDQGEISVNVEMPIGSELHISEQMADKLSAIVEESVPEMETLYYSVGDSGTGMSMSSGDSFSITVSLMDKGDRDRSLDEIVNDIRENVKNVPGAEITVSAGGSMDPSAMMGEDIDVTLKGDNYDVLTETADRLAEEIAKLPDATDVVSSAAEQMPGVTISLNREIASQMGLTAGQVGTMVRQQITGTEATEVRMDGDEVTLTVRGDSDSYNSVDAVKSLQITTAMGSNVPLSMIADVEVELEPQSVHRIDQTRAVSVTGVSISGNTTALNREVQNVLDSFELPDGVEFESGGATEEVEESVSDLVGTLFVALFLVYFVLAAQYESFLLPVMIMLILPVSLFGAVATLPLVGQKLSTVALIAVVVLTGTVVNSSIVLVEYIITRREMGESRHEAIMNACPLRVRPILMTTMTTVLGLLPMALSNGEGSEMMRPMAVAMIGGMLVSMVVALLLTPVFYVIVDNFSEWLKRKRGTNV